MDDELKALFLHEEPGPRFKPSEVAAIIAEPGMDAEKVAHEIRQWLRSGLVQTREQVGRGELNRHLSLSVSDAAVAKVLSILKWDYGITDFQVLSFVSAGLYGWQDGDPTPKADRLPHPVMNAVRDVAREKDWCFRLDSYRDLKTGGRKFHTALFDLDAIPKRRFPDGAMPRGSIMLNLRSHFLSIASAWARKGQAN